MEFISMRDIAVLSNPGVRSRQLINPDNSDSRRVTLTEVRVDPGACQVRHIHEFAEQIWYALQGSGLLLLADNTTKRFCAGDVVRFAEGDIHGLENDSDAAFIYLSVTAPPIHYGYAYSHKE